MNNKGINDNSKEEVTTNVNRVNDASLEKTMEEHMRDNKKNTKIVIDWNTVFIYVIMLAIVITLAVLLLKFCEKYDQEEKKTTTTSTTSVTTTTTSQEVIYNTTTRAQTQATHTVFDRDRYR